MEYLIGVVQVEDTLPAFKQNHSDIEFITLLVGNFTESTKLKFKDGDYVYSASDENFDIAITDNIYNLISSGIFVTGEEKIKRKTGFFETEDGYNAIADEEIIYGATLTVDYSIHVQSHQTLSNITITDYIPEGK